MSLINTASNNKMSPMPIPRWKREKLFFMWNVLVISILLMSGCSREMESKESSADISSNTEVADDVNVEESNTQEESGNDEMNEQSLKDSEMKIRVSDGENEVLYLLNDSPAAMSLYSQLPLDVEVENYGSNEKIFYPPEELDTTDGIIGAGPYGTLAYFSPWGNVVMYYSPCGEYPGLFLLGEPISGEDTIEKMSGSIHIEVYEG